MKQQKLFDSQYFPCVNWFKNSISETNIVLTGSERFKKRSFYNRCGLVGSNGLIFLSVPLEGGRNRNQKELFRNVKISYAESWRKIHFRTIESCYANSPFYAFYRDDLAKLFEKRFTYLYDLNLEIIRIILSYLHKDELVVEITDDYYDMGAGIGYYPDTYGNVEPSPRYTQLFEDKVGFKPNVSILDLLFMEGNNSSNILKSTT